MRGLTGSKKLLLQAEIIKLQVPPLTARDLFLEAIENHPPENWMQFLTSACADDLSLREHVEKMLKVHDPTAKFMNRPAAEILTGIVDVQSGSQIDSIVGSTIGRYRILEKIGEGGMGDVYMASQLQPVQRKVALKIIKAGMNTREVVARFEAERQALALMNHPNIAKVLDGGDTESGRPYFVMELVRGSPITDFCDARRLTVRERLQLFNSMCDAVQHAHQKGIIHRDLKPSNVLVEIHDVKSVPKVIDFGVAKAIGQQLTERTLFTAFQQMVGTPLYMSPEQAGSSSLDVDTRSDVYSLGVILYELLTSQTPFEKEILQKTTPEEIRRMIREVDPPRPSVRISTLKNAAISTLSQQRGLEIGTLQHRLRGELDWITMKALEKDRNHRYDSASAFAMDLQRYLDDEPVQACPPSTVYRLRKMVGKHRVALGTLGAVGLALILGTGISVWQVMVATSARRLADNRLANERKALDEANRQRTQASTNLKQALEAVDKMLLRVAGEQLANLPGAEPIQRELFQDALKFYEDFFDQAPDDPQLRQNMAKAWARVGTLHDFLGDTTKCQQARQEAIRRWEVLHAEYPDNVEIQFELVNALGAFANCEHWNLFRFESAGQALERAHALSLELVKRCPDRMEYAWLAVDIERTLGDNYKCRGQLELAETTLRHVIDVGRELWLRDPVSGKSHPILCLSLGALVAFLREIKHEQSGEVETLWTESLRRAEEILSNDKQSPSAACALIFAAGQYGKDLILLGKAVEAKVVLRRAVDVGQQVRRTGSLRDYYHLWCLPHATLELADLLVADGSYLEALTCYRTVSEFLRPTRGFRELDPHMRSGTRRANLGILNCLKHLADEGESEETRKICEELSAVDGTTPEGLAERVRAALAWDAIGESGQYERLTDELVQQSQALLDRSRDELNESARRKLGRAFYDCGDNEFHRLNYDRALPLLEMSLRWNPTDPEVLSHRGQIFLDQGDFERGFVDLDAAVVQSAEVSGYYHSLRAQAYFRLGNFQRAMADLQASSGRYAAIDPAEVALCPDEAFRQSYLDWFQAATSVALSSEKHLIRAALWTELKQVERAVADLDALSANASATTIELSNAAVISLRLGDIARYRQFCQLLSARIPAAGTVGTAPEAYSLIWAIALAPQAIEDYSPIIQFAQEAVAKKSDNQQYLIRLGAVLMRARKYEQAWPLLQQAMKAPDNRLISKSYSHFFLAMTEFHLGQTSQAQNSLDIAVALAEDELRGFPTWSRRMTIHLLQMEATTLLSQPRSR